ncbi:hypothetical protein BURPS1710b_1514 [Burkholderia pseudomallei 1710b]|uniref:Uncharacterized protein n=1 Tax=Burkholderia pseudomallei (strain 1710b) TaxID=320372 RepID=Q3JU36_BURP1|nr:hypothetical protein BURPS1710b_1514 [Burkholderia pseudomallei 1710b]
MDLGARDRRDHLRAEPLPREGVRRAGVLAVDRQGRRDRRDDRRRRGDPLHRDEARQRRRAVAREPVVARRLPAERRGRPRRVAVGRDLRVRRHRSDRHERRRGEGARARDPARDQRGADAHPALLRADDDRADVDLSVDGRRRERQPVRADLLGARRALRGRDPEPRRDQRRDLRDQQRHLRRGPNDVRNGAAGPGAARARRDVRARRAVGHGARDGGRAARRRRAQLSDAEGRVPDGRRERDVRDRVGLADDPAVAGRDAPPARRGRGRRAEVQGAVLARRPRAHDRVHGVRDRDARLLRRYARRALRRRRVARDPRARVLHTDPAAARRRRALTRHTGAGRAPPPPPSERGTSRHTPAHPGAAPRGPARRGQATARPRRLPSRDQPCCADAALAADAACGCASSYSCFCEIALYRIVPITSAMTTTIRIATPNTGFFLLRGSFIACRAPSKIRQAGILRATASAPPSVARGGIRQSFYERFACVNRSRFALQSQAFYL